MCLCFILPVPSYAACCALANACFQVVFAILMSGFRRPQYNIKWGQGVANRGPLVSLAARQATCQRLLCAQLMLLADTAAAAASPHMPPPAGSKRSAHAHLCLGTCSRGRASRVCAGVQADWLSACTNGNHAPAAIQPLCVEQPLFGARVCPEPFHVYNLH